MFGASARARRKVEKEKKRNAESTTDEQKKKEKKRNKIRIDDVKEKKEINARNESLSQRSLKQRNQFRPLSQIFTISSIQVLQNHRNVQGNKEEPPAENMQMRTSLQRKKRRGKTVDVKK